MRAVPSPSRVVAVLSFVALAGVCSAARAQPATPAPIPYPSVSAARAALIARDGVDGVIVTHPDGWILVTDAYASVQWSFTPEGYYAYPALVRRSIKRDPKGEPQIEIAALCEAAKEACDKLMVEFEQSSDRMRQSIRARNRQGSSQEMERLQRGSPPSPPETQPPSQK